MKIDFSGSKLFLEYLEGQCTLQSVIEHPAYQAVFHHADHFSDGMKVLFINGKTETGELRSRLMVNVSVALAEQRLNANNGFVECFNG